MQSIEEIKKGLEAKTLHENESIEFKVRIPPDKASIAKHCVGIANSGGGFFIVGVQETPNRLKLIGIKNKNKGFITKLFDDICRDYTINVEYKVSFICIHNADILVVTISCLGEKAYFRGSIPIAYFRDSIGRLSFSKYRTVYKYMSLEAFILSLYKGAWKFFEPTKWNDRFERRFYCANFSPDKNSEASKLFATCVTKKQNNEAAWKVYAHGLGLGAHCVQLELDVAHLREEFDHSSSQYHALEGTDGR